MIDGRNVDILYRAFILAASSKARSPLTFQFKHRPHDEVIE
jgi:hypothetical protein